MVLIEKATIADEKPVLEILDSFRVACLKILNPEATNPISTTAQEYGKNIYKSVLKNDIGAVFLAKTEDKVVGIITVYLIPQIRRGGYCAEIEEFFVLDKYQGQNVAEELMKKAFLWSKERNVAALRLECSLPLERAHAFYEKFGFKEYAKGFQIIL